MSDWICYLQGKRRWDKLDLYAKRIQKLEKELEIEITDFSEWELYEQKLLRYYDYDYDYDYEWYLFCYVKDTQGHILYTL
jgi:hypothetical protein